MPFFVENKSIVAPGDLLAEGEYRAGDGVLRYNSKFFAMYVGLVEVRGTTISVVPLRGSYIPQVGDIIIGKVIDYTLTTWKVDINSPYIATLSVDQAINKKFDITRDSLTNYYNIGDALIAKIIAFSRVEPPIISTRDKGLGKLRGGMLTRIHPTRVPRLIGRKGSMINMIKNETGCKIRIGQNGIIWIYGKSPELEYIVVKAIRKIEREAHTSGLTDRVRELIRKEKEALRGGSNE
ncbi:MAG: exosome complex RNA-binding protein Rrp4 [Candidatus Asgardarchaeia archaeon]